MSSIWAVWFLLTRLCPRSYTTVSVVLFVGPRFRYLRHCNIFSTGIIFHCYLNLRLLVVFTLSLTTCSSKHQYWTMYVCTWKNAVRIFENRSLFSRKKLFLFQITVILNLSQFSDTIYHISGRFCFYENRLNKLKKFLESKMLHNFPHYSI